MYFYYLFIIMYLHVFLLFIHYEKTFIIKGKTKNTTRSEKFQNPLKKL